MKNYAYYKSLGVCPECGKREPEPGKVHCAQCSATRKAYFKAHREMKNASTRKWTKSRKEAGLCRQCGKPTDKGIFCEDCAYVRNLKRRIVTYRKRKGTWSGKIFDEVTLNRIAFAVLYKLGWL